MCGVCARESETDKKTNPMEDKKLFLVRGGIGGMWRHLFRLSDMCVRLVCRCRSEGVCGKRRDLI